MSTYQQLLLEFTSLDLQDSSKLTQFQINSAVDRLAAQNAHMSQFNRDISIQIWQHANKTPEGKVLLKDYIQTLTDAIDRLKENIQKCKQQLRVKYNQDRQQIEEYLQSYQQDLKNIKETFNLKNNSFPQSAAKSAAVSPNIQDNHEFLPQRASQKSKQSLSLKYTFILVILMILLQIFCMFVRHHFINILANLSVLSIFVLQYFDKTYIKFVLTVLTLAVGSDVAWLCFHFSNYWDIPQETQYSHLQNSILALVYILTVILAVAKQIIFWILFSFRQIQIQTSTHVNFLGITIELSGYNPTNVVTNLLVGKKNNI